MPLVFSLAILATLTAPSTALSGQRVGDLLPTSFKLVSLDGRAESFADTRGTVRIVNVWATWCRPCVLELPSLAAMADSLAADGVRVYAIAADRPDRVRRFLGRGIATPEIWFEKERLPSRWGRWAMPTTWVVGRDDQLLHVHYGAARWDSPSVLADLRRLIRNDKTGEGVSDE